MGGEPHPPAGAAAEEAHDRPTGGNQVRRQRKRFVQSVLGLICLCANSTVFAEEPDAAAIDFFESKIRPVLVEHCYECHSGDSKQLRGGLRVDTRNLIREGGDSGPAVVPDDPGGSLLLEAMKYESFEMPPDGKLSAEVIADFEKWISMGAPDPRDGEAAAPAEKGVDIEAGREFWSFRPFEEQIPPTSRFESWCLSEIDRFIAAGWESEGLTPSPDAERRTLIRRASFHLTGLPPSPEEIDRFVNDPAPDAYEQLIDRLLHSPHFGERWGRHWLDIARYADTTGGGRSLMYGQAWRYRDYVIESFNRDKPYDRFIMEQLAGDLLPYNDYRRGQEQLVATGFLVLGPSNYENQDKEQLRMDVVDEQIDTMGRAFLGMTIGCARCHDHKFDPIPTSDYYALAGIFRSTHTLIHDNVSTWVKQPLPVDPETRAILDAHTAEVAALTAEIAQRRSELQSRRAQLPIVTLDDTEADFTGNWSSSGGVKEFVGEGYRYASGGSAVASYAFNLKYPGQYEVRVSYSPHGNRSTNARIVVEHLDGQSEHRVNQQEPPPIEQLYLALGRYEFSSTARVSILTEETEGTVIADAVQLVPLFRVDSESTGARIVADPEDLSGVVVDDTAAELVGEWKDSTYLKSYVGAGYIHDERMGQGAKQVVFRTDLPASGEYDVRLSYNHADSRASRVPVKIAYPGGEETVFVNQREEPNVDGLFSSVGRFQFNNDQTAVVTVSNEGVDDGYVIVDAVQFVPTTKAAVADGDTRVGESSAKSETADAMALLERITALETELSSMDEQLKALKENAPPQPPMVLSVQEEADTGDYFVCIRGNVKNLGEPAPRGVLTVATQGDSPEIPDGVSGRLELARWIASPENPLTARVMVNRIWHHLFGAGIVRTVDNFGLPGERPSHPELLDHLAARFVEQGWSVKAMIREIMLSRTYRLSGAFNETQRAADPENRLLSHQNRRRLDAEEIYDSLLSLSGRLDLTAGGDSVRPGTTSEYGYEFDVGRRGVYQPVLRNQLHELFEAFDFPDPNLSQGRRATSTLSTQALFFMNSPLVVSQSEAAAHRVLHDAETDEERIDLLYRRALGRPPTGDEVEIALDFLSETDSGDLQQAWVSLCQAVIGTIEFRYTE
ncbi:MAG: DUF1553 domain-containing protein [Planctomycetota bacterium]|nr:MAG: DUF1553 domain-containing protein [Planctomycetota bacterium]REK29768.1 MAG: DUF1553 domain-containing protein [Planctomycetota bacterium]REK30412.1 MAG: DUF1553 domain-containing protein [Planctomycetota bacterium]